MSSLYQSKWATPAPHPPPPSASHDPSRDQVSTQESEPTNGLNDAPTSASTLSAVAPAFSPTPAPPPDVSTYDEFAQTGAAQDDLFDDVIPLEESMQTRLQDDLFGDDFTPAAQQIVEHAEPAPVPLPPTQAPAAPTSRGRGRGRGRGGQAARTENPVQSNGSKTLENGNDGAKKPAAQAPENAPSGPRKETAAAVRGDRHATGGVRKPKLSETELAEKMAQIQIKNATLTAAHVRAEADAASFAQREQEAKAVASQRSEAAKVRAKEERKDRQQMMGEREKNRMRKLKAMDAREWDAEKDDGDFAKGGKNDKKGGFAGDKADYSDGREYLLREPKEHASGRGGRRNEGSSRPQHQAIPPKPDEFPALPSIVAVKEVNDTEKGVESPMGADQNSSWADQVESSAAPG